MGICNERLHELMMEWAQCTSLKGNICTSRQADIIISCMEKIKTPAFPGRKHGYSLTEAQWNKLMADMNRLVWNMPRLIGFAKHTLQITTLDSIADLTVKEATSVITGLKNMIKPKIKQVI
jgi:hypothetical protein